MKRSLKLLAFAVKSEIGKRFPGLVARPSFEEIRDVMTSPGLPFEIEQVEIDGRPIRSWKRAAPTMAALLQNSLQYADREYIQYKEERLSFAEHFQRSAAVAHQLVERFGIRKGDRVAIAMRNYPEWSIAFWAAAATGAVVVPLNAWWTGDELTYGLRDSGTRLLFADAERLQRLRETNSEHALEHTVAVRCETGSAPRIESLWQNSANFESLPSVDLNPDDNATLFYTSGTTGSPKGTLGTHRNFCSAALTMPYSGVQGILRSGGSILDLVRMKKTARTALLTVPLFHVSGCHGMMLAAISHGGKLVLMHKWDPEVALQLIARENINIFSGVPTMIRQLLDANESVKIDLSAITNIGYGGSPAPPDLLRRIKKAMPEVGASNGWGITECSAGFAANSRQDYAEKPDSVGPAAPVCDVIVVDDAGEQAERGELGELWVRGPNVVKGYWQNPEATATAFTDGWFHTGDVGRIDTEGFIYIVDRLKDMIIRGGENVYCAEVEAALSDAPSVIMACVFGIPDEVLGEVVCAVVQVVPDKPTSEEELKKFLAKRLAAFKVPEKLWIRHKALPTGATGKIQKKELQAFYANAEASLS